MRSKIKFFLIIAVGVMFVGAQAFVPGEVNAEEDSEAALTGGVVDRYNAILDDRDGMVKDLAEYWATQSEESVETLEQIFSKANTQQLLAIDQSTVYEQVQAALDLGDVNRDLVFTPVAPCAIVDTRFGGGGFFAPFEIRSYSVHGNLAGQGGANCPSPRGEPRAAALNLVAAFPNGTGNVQAFPFGAGPGAGLSVNYGVTGFNFANAGTIQTCFGCGPDISVTSRFAGTHVIIAVLGYYHEVDKDDADRLALAYANIDGTGTLSFRSRTENVTGVLWNAANQWYEITIAGENFFFTNYSVVVTPVPTNDVVARTSSVSGRLIIQFLDAIPAGEGSPKQADFSFVVFKDQ